MSCFSIRITCHSAAGSITFTLSLDGWHYNVFGPSIYAWWFEVYNGCNAKIATTTRAATIAMPTIITFFTNTWCHHFTTVLYCYCFSCRRCCCIFIITIFIIIIAVDVYGSVFVDCHRCIDHNILGVVNSNVWCSLIDISCNCMVEGEIMNYWLWHRTSMSSPYGAFGTLNEHTAIVFHYCSKRTIYYVTHVAN